MQIKPSCIFVIALFFLGFALGRCNNAFDPSAGPALTIADEEPVGRANGGLLSGFEEEGVWDTAPAFPVSFSGEHVTQGKRSLKAEFPVGEWPSVNTKKLPQKWGDYAALAFDVYNPQDETIPFHVRLDDAGGRRATIPYTLKPGMNHVQLTRGAISVDPGNIRFVVFFIARPKKAYTLYFDNLRLEDEVKVRAAHEAYKDAPPLKVPEPVAYMHPPQPQSGEIRIAIARLDALPEKDPSVDEVSSSTAKDPLVSSGVPFAPGQLKDADRIAFVNDAGEAIPFAAKELARWPDGSVRSVLVQFRYPVKDRFAYVRMRWGDAAEGSPSEKIVEPRWDLPEAILVLSPEWLCASQVAGEHVPMDRHAFPEYDAKIRRYFPSMRDKAFTGKILDDHYYNTAHVFYQLYVRSGEPEYFVAARKALLHYRDTQIVHEGEERGRAKENPKPQYVFVQAMADDYFLTGDPRSLEVARWMTDFLVSRLPPEKVFYAKDDDRFWTERNAGFTLLGVVTFYEMTLDEKYRKLAETYVEQLHRTQLEWPSRGGFIHNMYSHDPEEGARPDEYGGSPFMTGLVLEGLVKMHRLTGDPTAADAIFRALEWLIDEGLGKGGQAFRYLTIDKFTDSSGEPDVNLVVAHAFGYGYRLSGFRERRYLDTGLAIFRKGVKSGYAARRKHFNQHFRSSGHFLAYIQAGLKEAQGPSKKEEAPSVAAEKTPVPPPAEMPKSAAEATNSKVENAQLAGQEEVVQKLAEPRNRETRTFVDSSPSGAFWQVTFDGAPGGFEADGVVAAVTQAPGTPEAQAAGASGQALQLTSPSPDTPGTVTWVVEGWSLTEAPGLELACAAEGGAGLAVEVRTLLGDWLCVAKTEAGVCLGHDVAGEALGGDEAWQALSVPVAERVQARLSSVRMLDALRFVVSGPDGAAVGLDTVRVGP